MDFFERAVYDMMLNVVAPLIVAVASPFIINGIRRRLLKKNPIRIRYKTFDTMKELLTGFLFLYPKQANRGGDA